MANGIEIVVNAKDNATRVFAQLNQSIGMVEQQFKRLYDVSKKFAQDTQDLKLQQQFQFAENAAKDFEKAILSLNIAGRDIPHWLGDAAESAGKLSYIFRAMGIEAQISLLENLKSASQSMPNFMGGVFASLGIKPSENLQTFDKQINDLKNSLKGLGAEASKTETKSVLDILKGAKIGNALKSAFNGVAEAVKNTNDELRKMKDLLMEADDAIRRGDARRLARVQGQISDAGLDPKRMLKNASARDYLQQSGINVNIYLDGEVVQSAARGEIIRGTLGGGAKR